MVSELREMDTVFLAGHSLCRLPFLHIKDLYRLIVGSGHNIIALVIEIKRGYMQREFWLRRAKCLE